MKPIKKILITGLLLALSIGVKAQSNASPGFGLSFYVPTSNKITFTPGIGICENGLWQNTFGYRFALHNQFYVDLGEYGVQGTSAVGSYPKETVTFVTYGLTYMIGVDYYLIRRQLYITAAPFISYRLNGDLSLFDNVVIGNPNTVNNYNVDDLTSDISLNYGVAVGGGYEFGKHKLSLNVCIGLTNLTPGLVDDNNKVYNTHLATVMLTYQYSIKYRTIAKTTTNKILK